MANPVNSREQETMELLEGRLKELVNERVDALVAQRLEQLVARQIAESEVKRTKRLAIVVSKGTLEAAYEGLILGTTAAAMDIEAGIFFTFFGLHILKRGAADRLRIVPVGNPAMPMPIPNVIAALPGMTALATVMMKQTIRRKNIATIAQLLEAAMESGVTLWPCQMTMDMMDVHREDLIDGLAESVGAATFLEFAAKADITLFI